MKKYIEVNDPIHGFIELSELETKIIDSAPYQRLRRIKQLSGGHFVYPTAEHTRFGHCMGALYLASRLGEKLLPSIGLDEDTIQDVRIAGLLHDIGHGPFSHVFEEALVERRGQNHEDITEWIIQKSVLGDILTDGGVSSKKIADLVRGRWSKKKDAVPAGIVAGQIDVDKMDYLVRDSFYCGVSYGFIDVDRLIDSAEVGDDYIIEFNVAARGTLEAFLVARYEMFMNVYYHKAVRSVEVMLVKLMRAADNALGLTTFQTPEEFLELDDISLISQIRELDPSLSEEATEAVRMVKRLDSRDLYKPAFEKILHTDDKFVSKVLTKHDVRKSLEREIAEAAKISPSEVIVDVPTLPSVPHNPRQIETPMEINVFEFVEGQKTSRNLSVLSKIAEMMKGYLDVIRVYTNKEHRAIVEREARKLFQETPTAAQIHM
ncbi:MAG: HD domain-containing protein [Candidatus Thorarchaeota archaeon]|nr:HD domain-containing protein [Candidatus Thorarchaeota archaeon]